MPPKRSKGQGHRKRHISNSSSIKGSKKVAVAITRPRPPKLGAPLFKRTFKHEACMLFVGDLPPYMEYDVLAEFGIYPDPPEEVKEPIPQTCSPEPSPPPEDLQNQMMQKKVDDQKEESRPDGYFTEEEYEEDFEAEPQPGPGSKLKKGTGQRKGKAKKQKQKSEKPRQINILTVPSLDKNNYNPKSRVKDQIFYIIFLVDGRFPSCLSELEEQLKHIDPIFFARKRVNFWIVKDYSVRQQVYKHQLKNFNMKYHTYFRSINFEDEEEYYEQIGMMAQKFKRILLNPAVF